MPAIPSKSRDDQILQVLVRHPYGTLGLACLIVLAVCLSAWGPASNMAKAIVSNTTVQEKMETLQNSSAPAATIDPPSAPMLAPAFPANDTTPSAQQALYTASLAYIANSPAAAIPIARSLGYAQGEGDPNSMCGPLAIAILRDAGLINKYVDPQAFWLWRPDKNPELAEITFPADRFTHYQFPAALNNFDFKSFPLEPGDFLYLYAGNDNISYEHMLVVNRVDPAGRAYSVTNIKTDGGFIVQEVMLYDPSQPGVGQFYEWTDRQNYKNGLTGTGGFELWRMTAAPPDPTPQETKLAEQIDQAISQTGGQWHILIKQINGAVIYSRQADDLTPVESLVDVPIAMLWFKSLEQTSIPADQYSSYLATRGIGRTYDQLLEAMLVHSEDDATNALLSEARSRKLDTTQTLSTWGINKMNVDTRVSTASQLAVLLEGLYSGNWILPEGRAVILDLLSRPVSGDSSHLGILRTLLARGDEFYEKHGTVVDETHLVGDSAIVTLPDHQGTRGYVVVILSTPQSNGPTPDELLAAVQQIARAFWSYAISSP
jgi:hypothetical protein